MQENLLRPHTSLVHVLTRRGKLRLAVKDEADRQLYLAKRQGRNRVSPESSQV